MHRLEVLLGPGVDEAASEEPVGQRRPGVIYGLANLVENALKYGPQGQTVTLGLHPGGPGRVLLVDDVLTKVDRTSMLTSRPLRSTVDRSPAAAPPRQIHTPLTATSSSSPT